MGRCLHCGAFKAETPFTPREQKLQVGSAWDGLGVVLTVLGGIPVLGAAVALWLLLGPIVAVAFIVVSVLSWALVNGFVG
jgi:hypothetical protein